MLQLAEYIGRALKNKSWFLATAESCTGGWIAEAITSIPGSSHWFDRGFVSYSNTAKQEMLGVKAETLTAYGAVSEAVAKEMAEGALQHSQAQIAVSVTGIAGPDGGSLSKPVGTVWLAFAAINIPTRAYCYHFQGDRYSIRLQTVQTALEGLVTLCP